MTMRPPVPCLQLLAIAGGVHAWRRSAAMPAPATLAADDPRVQTGEGGIVTRAAHWCGDCRRQQADFARAQGRYTVLHGRRAAATLGRQGMPVTVIGQHVVAGDRIADDIRAALDAHLQPLG